MFTMDSSVMMCDPECVCMCQFIVRLKITTLDVARMTRVEMYVVFQKGKMTGMVTSVARETIYTL